MSTSMFFALLVAACAPKPAVPVTETPAQAPQPTSTAKAAPAIGAATESSFTADGRVVAIGDVHGDFAAMIASLRLAELVDEDGKWVGGDTTLVQTGDLLDRGDDEQQIVDYLEGLKASAAAAGGRLVLLNGNHEVMNVAGDLRYVTPGGFADFADVPGLDLTSPRLQQLPDQARARMAAFMPGGPYAKVLATKLVVAKVNDTLFAHGGVLPHHAEYGLDAINQQTSDWMMGRRDAPAVLSNDDAPIWTRIYSDGAADCTTLDKTLQALDAKRMVVGHTVQESGTTSDCDGKIWRIDVGMAAHYGGKPAALEIAPDGARVVGPAL